MTTAKSAVVPRPTVHAASSAVDARAAAASAISVVTRSSTMPAQARLGLGDGESLGDERRPAAGVAQNVWQALDEVVDPPGGLTLVDQYDKCALLPAGLLDEALREQMELLGGAVEQAQAGLGGRGRGNERHRPQGALLTRPQQRVECGELPGALGVDCRAGRSAAAS